MPNVPSVAQIEAPLAVRRNVIVAVTLMAGLALRIAAASISYLNPDEAFQVLLAAPGSARELYQSAIRLPQPPLFIALLHFIRQITLSEIGLRALPVLAGSAVPWIVYRWLARSWSDAAALTALMIVALAPNLVYLNAEIRPYSLLLLLVAAALYLLDSAIDRGSPARMALFALCQWLAILCDYSAVFFFIAAGAYFVLRIRENTITNGIRIVWEFGEIAAVFTYGFLIMTGWQTLSGGIAAWMLDAYPQPGQGLAGFALRGAMKQFSYLFPNLLPLGAAVVAAGLGIVVVSRAKKALLAFPFLLACAAAIWGLYPFGRSRYTAVLAIFIAAAAGIGVGRIVRGRIAPIILAAVFLVPAWHVAGVTYYDGALGFAYPKLAMEGAVKFLRRSVPPGSLILTESESRSALAFYLGATEWRPEMKPLPSIESLGGYRVFAARYSFGSGDDARADAEVLRKQLGLDAAAPIWIVDGGFSAASADSPGSAPMLNVQRFGPRLAAYQLSQGNQR